MCEKYTGLTPKHVEELTIDQIFIMVSPIEALGGEPEEWERPKRRHVKFEDAAKQGLNVRAFTHGRTKVREIMERKRRGGSTTYDEFQANKRRHREMQRLKIEAMRRHQQEQSTE